MKKNVESTSHMSDETGADPGMGRSGHGPLFWQLSQFSLFWGYISVNFPPISTLDPLFLQIPEPALWNSDNLAKCMLSSINR